MHSKKPPQHHISHWRHTKGFGSGLFPVRSPLLRESLLVSFPPLTDMLKFSGYSRLIRVQDCKYNCSFTSFIHHSPAYNRHRLHMKSGLFIVTETSNWIAARRMPAQWDKRHPKKDAVFINAIWYSIYKTADGRNYQAATNWLCPWDLQQTTVPFHLGKTHNQRQSRHHMHHREISLISITVASQSHHFGDYYDPECQLASKIEWTISHSSTSTTHSQLRTARRYCYLQGAFTTGAYELRHACEYKPSSHHLETWW